MFDDVAVTTQTIEGDDVTTAIVERADDFDLTIIGASREGLLQQLVLGSIPEEVGRQVNGTVIMAKRYVGITSRVTRWLRSQRT